MKSHQPLHDLHIQISFNVSCLKCTTIKESNLHIKSTSWRICTRYCYILKWCMDTESYQTCSMAQSPLGTLHTSMHTLLIQTKALNQVSHPLNSPYANHLSKAQQPETDHRGGQGAVQDMEHQHANLCSRLGTAAGISHGSPLPGGKKRNKKMQFPQQ